MEIISHPQDVFPRALAALATPMSCGVERVSSTVTRVDSDSTAQSLQDHSFRRSLFLQSHREVVEDYAADCVSEVPSFGHQKKFF